MEAASGAALDVQPTEPEEPRLQGLVLLDEQSIVRDDCVRKRWAVLTDHSITFSRTEKSSQKKEWSLHHRCKVQPDTGVQKRTCRVLHSRYMVLSLSYKHSKQTLYCFTVSWPARASSSQTKRSRLLAFRDEGEATKWHEAISAAISASALPDTPSLAETPAVPVTPTTEFSQHGTGFHTGPRHSRTSSMPSPLANGGGSVHFRGIDDNYNTPRQLDDSDVGHIGTSGGARTPACLSNNGQQGRSSQGACTSQERNHAASTGMLHSGMSLETEFANTEGCGFVGTTPECTETLSQRDMGRATSSESFLIAKTENAKKLDVHPNLRAWGRFHLINGLAIWKEGSGHSSAGAGAIHASDASASSYCSTSSLGLDSYMVSKRIRGTPMQVVKSLLRLDGRGSCFWAFDTVSDIHSLGSTDQAVLFKATMAPPNALQAAFASHRDFFLQRSCRKDDDESYVVLLHSVDRETREKHCFKATPGNVEGRIASMGFTVAPLKPAYRLKMGDRAMDSHECLVTLVLSADIGGWLGANSPLRYCFPFWSDLENSWLQRLLMTLVALGNKVDQDCFVKGEEDMVDSTFQVPHEPFLPNNALSYQGAASADDMPGGATAKVGRAASAHAAPDGGAAEHAGDSGGGAAAPGVLDQATKMASGVLKSSGGSTSALPSAGATGGSAGLDPRYFSDPGANNFRVRGKNYLVDKKKVPSEEPLFRLVAVDLVKTDAPVYHISRYLPIVRKSSAPFSFVLSFTLPYARRILTMMLIFEADEAYGGVGQHRGTSSDDESEEDGSRLSPFDLCLARFLADKGPLRDAKLKLIPSLAQGSWMIRQAVGQTPVMLGKRLKTQYFMENAYVEADIDISANATAAGVTSMVAGSIKNLVFDIGILLEGHSEEELPERLLGSVRLNHLDLRAARELDASVEIPAEQRPVPNGFFDDSKRSLSVSVPASATGSAPASASVTPTPTPTPSNQGTVKAY